MPYSLDATLFVEHGPAVRAARSAAARGSTRWRALGEQARLNAVERALKTAANDFADDLPVAL